MRSRSAWLGALALSALALPVLGAAGSGAYGNFGLGVRTGEAAGGFGSFVSYNLDRHWQASAGVGGISPLSITRSGPRSRTDSYFLLGRYYLGHWYLSAGCSVKIARAEIAHGGEAIRRSAVSLGIPFHLGYESGARRGFFLSSSAGGLFVPAGGGRRVAAGAGGETVSMRSARSGPSLGISLGYYFR